MQQAEQKTDWLMKYFTRLEKRKALWYLLFISFLFFLLRLPSFFEPDWSLDEGIYEVIGLALGQGKLLYAQIWDNKPPLIYLLYALFHSELLALRLVSLLFALLSVYLFFFLSQKLFEKRQISIVTTSIFAILFATPLFEGNIANAENFMILPILTAGYLIYTHSLSKTNRKEYRSRFYLMAGVLLGIAFLFKVVALFDFSAFLLYLLIINLPERLSFLKEREVFTNIIKNISPVLVGFLLPFFITVLYFFSQHALKDFIESVLSNNVGYVGVKNNLLIPQGTLLLKVLLLTVFVFLVSFKRKTLQHATIFILLWFSFSLFNALFSGLTFPHYLLVAIASISLVLGLLFARQNRKARASIFLLLIIAMCLLFATFGNPHLRNTFLYYRNFLLFETGQRDITSYQAFFPVCIESRNYEIAQFIKTHTTPSDTIFIWGNCPQIYVLAGKLPPGKYQSAAFQITFDERGPKQTELTLKRTPPKYIVVLAEMHSFPFDMTSYTKKLTLEGATIYERIS